MVPLFRTLPSRDRRRRISLSQRHHPMPGTYFVGGALGTMPPSNQALLNFGNPFQLLTPWTNMMSAPASQEVVTFNDVPLPPSSGASYECNHDPSGILLSESFPTSNQEFNHPHQPGNSYMYPEPWNLPWMHSSYEASSSTYGLDTSNRTSSNCGTPLMENDVPLDFDFASDPRIAPSDSTGFPWNGSFDSNNSPYSDLKGNVPMHGYNLERPEAQNSMEDFLATRDPDETICCSQFEPLDQPIMRDTFPETSLPPGPHEQQENPYGQDTEQWKCEIPGCGKTFDKRHRFNKHLASHSRILRCPFKNCKRRAYQEKDIKRHIEAVHHKAKIPCPVESCPYSRNGPKRGISRKDALMRHLRSHGITELPPEDSQMT